MTIPHIAYSRLASPPQKKKNLNESSNETNGLREKSLLSSDGEISLMWIGDPWLQLAYHKL